MKRDVERLELRNAFCEMPEACRRALIRAASSVEEEVPVKKATFRAVLIAALIIVATTAVALAAGSLLGWPEFFREHASNVAVPKVSLEEMKNAEGFSCTAGPLTFETVDLITDGHMVMSSIHIKTTDGSAALITSEPYEAIGAISETALAMAERLEISPETTWIDAAKQLQLPLYCVRGISDLPAEIITGDAFEDPMWNEDGSLLYFSREMLRSEQIGDTLEVPYYLYAAQIDPDTGEEKKVWRNRDQVISLPVCSLLETREYIPVMPMEYEGYKLVSVHAERYVTGAYLTFDFVPANGDLMASAYHLHALNVLDSEAGPLPDGMMMSASIQTKIEMERMVGIESLPETLTLSDGTALRAR